MFARIVSIIGVSVLLAGGCVLDGTAHAQVDVSNETVTCNSFLKATMKISPPLVLGGTAPTTVKIQGKLGGCSTTAPGVSFPDFKSSFKGEFTLPTNDCLAFAAASAAGSITVKWKANQSITPSASTVTITGGDMTGGGKLEAWGAQYLYLGLGVNSRPSGVAGTALDVSGAFTGGNGGATSTADFVSGEDGAGVFLAQCVGGNKQIDLSVGQLKLQ